MIPRGDLDRRSFLPTWRTAVCGLFTFLCAPHVGWGAWIWIWIGLPLFIDGLRRLPTPLHGMVQGAWFSFLYGIGIYFWSIRAMMEFLDIPLAASVGIWIIAALIGQLHFVVAAGAFLWIPSRLSGAHYSRHPLLAMLLYASMFAALDAFAPKLFGDSIGHGFFHFPRLMQLADLGGAPVLTFVLGLWSYAAFASYRRWRERLSRPWIPLVAGFIIVGCGALYGEFRLRELNGRLEQPARSVKVLVVQPNVSNERKRAASRGQTDVARKLVDEIAGTTTHALVEAGEVDFVFWPEAAVPNAYLLPRTIEESVIDDRIDEFIESTGFPLVFGGDDADPDTGDRFNAVFIRHPVSRSERRPFDLKVYRKGLLMPFGERVPGVELFPFLGEFAPGLLKITSAGSEGPQAYDLRMTGGRSVRVSPIICYEAVRTEYVREGARMGSELILNATNDSWFAGWGEPQLHLAMSIFRSVETRLPQVRATNSGISALILPTGELRSVIDWDVSGSVHVDVPIIGPSRTLATLWGDWFGPASGTLFGVLLAGFAFAGRRGRD